MAYPTKTGKCEIRGCCRAPTEWHHVISKNQIERRGLHRSMYTDPGNLKEYCRYHHNMTTASMVRLHLLRTQTRITLADYCN